MKELVIEEKKFFWLNPNFRLDFYLVNVTAILLLIVGLIFKEFYFILLALLGLVFELKTFIKIVKTYKSPARRLAIQYDNEELSFSFDNQNFKISTKNLDRLFIILDPQESKKRRMYYYKIACQCGKKDKEIAKLPASVLAGDNIEKIKTFINENAPKVDIIMMKTEDLY